MSLGFIGGMAAALDGYTKASKDWENRELAQAAEQRRVEEHAYNQQVRQYTLDEKARAEQERQDMVKAAQPLEMQTQEILPPEDDPFTPRQITYKVGDQTFTDQSKAQSFAADPYAAMQRAADVKLRHGDVAGANNLALKMLESRDQAGKLKESEATRKANQLNDGIYRSLITADGRSVYENGAKLLTDLNKDGISFKAEKQANGTILMNKYGPDGTLLGTHGKPIVPSASSEYEFISGFTHAPSWAEKEKVYDRRIKLQQELRKEALETQYKQSTIARNMAQATGTGGFAKKPEKPEPDAISKGFQNWNPKDIPTGRADGERIAREAKALNPTATDQDLIYAAQMAVTERMESPNIKQRLDFNNGKVTAVFTDPRNGKQIKLYQTEPKPEMAPALKSEIQAYLNEQDALGAKLGSDVKWSDALKAAAANPKDSAAVAQVVQNTIASTLPTAQAEVMRRWEATNAQRQASGLPAFPKPTPEEIRSKVTSLVSSPQGMAAINRRISLVRNYGLN